VKIGNREIGGKTFIIAEAGVGHAVDPYEGGILLPLPLRREQKAMGLVGMAWEAGADAVKFQMFVPDEPLFCPLDGDDDRWVLWANTFMPFGSWQKVKTYADGIGITFLASAFQPIAVEWLKELKVDAYKVASRAVDNYPYGKVPGPFIISCGRAIPIQVGHLFGKSWRLQCDATYPCKPTAWNSLDGLSDHSGSVYPGLYAIAHQAPILEVHFKLKNGGPDDAVSLSIDQLKFLCEARDEFASLC